MFVIGIVCANVVFERNLAAAGGCIYFTAVHISSSSLVFKVSTFFFLENEINCSHKVQVSCFVLSSFKPPTKPRKHKRVVTGSSLVCNKSLYRTSVLLNFQLIIHCRSLFLPHYYFLVCECAIYIYIVLVAQHCQSLHSLLLKSLIDTLKLLPALLSCHLFFCGLYCDSSCD